MTPGAFLPSRMFMFIDMPCEAFGEASAGIAIPGAEPMAGEGPVFVLEDIPAIPAIDPPDIPAIPAMVVAAALAAMEPWSVGSRQPVSFASRRDAFCSAEGSIPRF